MTSRLRMNEAIAMALADEMRCDDRVVVFGEDVARPGGPFKTSAGLLEEFGGSRVRDTSISETAFLGIALGAAATGLRPVAEIMFVEFLGVALDQLVTEAAKFRYLSGGQLRVPMTVRASVGAGLGFGAQHSQGLETWLYATPGIKLAVASGAGTAYGLLRSAIREDNPVVVLEPRALYGTREQVTTGDRGVVPLGKAATVRSGDDITIVALGRMVGVAVEVADAADASVEVVDLRTLLPWDVDAVRASVARTGRLLVVEEGPRTGGWGTEIVSRITDVAWGDLQAPPVRVTAPDVPVPFARRLEERYAPWPDDVLRHVRALTETGRPAAAWWEERSR